MLTARKQFIEQIVNELNKIKGINNVCMDDYDSAGVNIFFDLISLDKFNFERDIRSIRNDVNRIIKRFSVGYRVIDYPVMKYEYVSVLDRCVGDPAKRKLGYDQSRFGIEVFA